MKHRWIWGVAAVVGGVAAAYAFWPKPSPELEGAAVANQIAAGKPINLPGGKQLAVNSPAANYFALPAGKERLAYLDKMIDQQEETRKKIASGEIKLPEGAMTRLPPGARAEVKDVGAPSKIEERTSADGSQKTVTVRLNSDDLSPEFRARMEEYHAALRSRRKERGLDPDAPMIIIRSETRVSESAPK